MQRISAMLEARRVTNTGQLAIELMLLRVHMLAAYGRHRCDVGGCGVCSDDGVCSDAYARACRLAGAVPLHDLAQQVTLCGL
jgi:hypothetical protein